MPNLLVENNYADISVCPQGDSARPANAKNQLTIGDLHGNALKLIYFLVRQNVITLDEADYNRIVNIYETETLTKNLLREFSEILDRVTVQPVGTVRLIGDEMADRGMNDYLTLKIFEMLRRHRVNVEILISNHGIEFLEACEKQKDFKAPRLLNGMGLNHAISLQRLNDLVKRGVVTRKEVLEMAGRCYNPFLRALSYTVSEDGRAITIYSHAGIGLQTIARIAEWLDVSYRDTTAFNLASTIDSINTAFQKYVCERTVHQLYDHKVMDAAYRDANYQISQMWHPFVFLMWNRQHWLVEKNRPAVHKGYQLDFVHGHDSDDLTQGNIYNLDNQLGKSRNHQGEYHILYSQDKPGVAFNINQDSLYTLYTNIDIMKKYGEHYFWHTQSYQTAVKLLKNAYVKIDAKINADDAARENAFIDYVRGNALMHHRRTSTRKLLLK